mgnify:CR=1 FL=1
MARLLVLDTETGGTDPLVHNILSIGCVIWEDGVLGERSEFLIAEPEVSVTKEALAVNNINVDRHWMIALPPNEAMRVFLQFLTTHFAAEIMSGEKITLVGHNVSFDVGFLQRFFRICGVSYRDYFSHRTVDTATIVRFLELVGAIPLKSASSTGAFEYFKIQVPDGKRHTAMADAVATGELLSRLVESGRGSKTKRKSAA